MVASYLLLILALLVIWVFGFVVGGRELLAPISIVPLSMLVGAVLALWGTNTWNDVTMGPQSSAIILLGTVGFVLGCAIYSLVIAGDGRRLRGIMDKRVPPALRDPADNTKYWVLLFVFVVLTALHMYEMVKLYGTGTVTSSFSEIAKAVRTNTSSVFSSGGIGLEDGFPLYDRVLSKVRNAIGVIAAAALPYEIIVHKRSVRSTIPVILTFLVSLVASLASGSRSGMVNAVIIAITSLFLSWQWRDGAVAAASRTALICLVGGLVMAGVFYVTGFVVGRPTQSGAVEYLTFYLGCGFPSLERVLAVGMPQFSLDGFNSFHEQYYLLSKLGLVGSAPAYGWFFLDIGQHPSNVFTFAYRYFADFGMVGTFLLSAVSGVGYTVLYRIARNNIHQPAILFCYCVIGAPLFDIMRDEKFFATVLTASNVITLAIAALITLWLYDPHARADRRTVNATPWIEEGGVDGEPVTVAASASVAAASASVAADVASVSVAASSASAVEEGGA